MSAALLLARFDDPEKLVPAVATLDASPLVTRWDAVDGHVDLVISVDANSGHIPDALLKLSGLSELITYSIANNSPRSISISPELASAYLFIDVQRGKERDVEKAILQVPQTVSCVAVTGGCDLVAVVSADSIAALGRIIEETIRPLDGIIRLKHNHIIDLKSL